MSTSREALVVVDVQNPYLSDLTKRQRQRLLQNIVKRIREAIKKGRWIFVLEWRYSGKLNERVLKALEGYTKHVRILKTKQDGSQQLWEWWNHLDRRILQFYVCGVLTDCCVKATIKGLLKKIAAYAKGESEGNLMGVHVYFDACATTGTKTCQVDAERALVEGFRGNQHFPVALAGT